MTPSAQVDKQINEEVQKFYDKPYDGKLKVPSNFIELFKKAAMSVAPNAHQIFFTRLKLIASRKPSELSNGEISDVVKLVLNTTPEKLYASFEEAVETHSQTEKFIRAFNEHVSTFMEQMKMKRTTLMDLSGANGGRINGSSLRTIN